MKTIRWFVRLINFGVCAMCIHLIVYDFSFLNRIRIEKLFSGIMVFFIFSLSILIRIIMLWIDQEKKENNSESEINIMAKVRKEFIFYVSIWLFIYFILLYRSGYYLPGQLKLSGGFIYSLWT